MSKTELMHQLRRRLRKTMSYDRSDSASEQKGSWRDISPRDVCNFLIGMLIGYMTLGW
jgi:hypothetical protein